MSVENSGWHHHRTSVIEGHNVCMDCGEIVIKPILDLNDPRLVPPSKGIDLQEVSGMLQHQGIDIVLIEIANRRDVPWPNYIDQLATKYEAPPPHVHLLYDENGNVRERIHD